MTVKIYEVGIAVDFGMTGSAVAWNEADSPEEIEIIKNWPGGTGHKVPTKISIDQFGEVGSWGFLCDSDSIHTKELFKVSLDSAAFNSSERTKLLEPRPKSSMEVENWSYFYLRSLIQYAITSIGEFLRKRTGSADIEIELLMHCVLTTPTTWDENAITKFGFIAERAICDARQNQTYTSSFKTIKVNITEPDAVANYILLRRMAPLSHGDCFLVVDVGGATSDPCFCQVAEIYGHHICLVLNREAPIRGIPYGCVDIDQTFHLHVMNRLRITGDSNYLSSAMQMRRGLEFQQYKTLYSGPQDNACGVAFVIPGWSKNASLQQAQIFQGRMIFAEFNVLLDEALVDRLRRHTSEILKFAPGPLKFLAIAGGGSHIPYIGNSVEHSNTAPLLLVPDLGAVAIGSLIKWNKQLLLMTVIVRDTPVRKFAIGTSQRAAGKDVITHTWRKNAPGKQTTVYYMVGQDLFQDQIWQKWEITIETANLAPPESSNTSEPKDRPAATIRVDLRLPRISPYVSGGDFTAYSADGIQVPCHATSTPVLYSG